MRNDIMSLSTITGVSKKQITDFFEQNLITQTSHLNN